MFSNRICEICLKRVECSSYKSGQCTVQDEIFNEFLQPICIENIKVACSRFVTNRTLLWYAEAYILSKFGYSASYIAQVAGKSTSATYTAIKRAKALMSDNNMFRTRIFMIEQYLRKNP